MDFLGKYNIFVKNYPKKQKKTPSNSMLRHKTHIHEATTVLYYYERKSFDFIYVLSLGHVKPRRLPIVVSVTVANWLLLLGKLET